MMKIYPVIGVRIVGRSLILQMIDTVNVQEIKDKLYANLEPSGWARKLRGFIYSGEFDSIILKLIKETQIDKRFTPKLKDVFKAFEECPYEELKVVMVGQDPYPQLNIADGIAFSCGKTMKEEPILKYIFGAIEDTVYQGEDHSWDPDLKRWSNQGILMLNIALTVEINKIGSHYLIWKPFITYLFDVLNSDNKGLVYIYMGKKAQEWMEDVNDNNYKLICSHPASAAYTGSKKWNCDDVFNKTSKIIKENYNFDINW